MQHKIVLLYLLLQGFGLLAQVGGKDVRISIDESSMAVEDLLAEIEQQSGSYFSYNPKVIDVEQKISFDIDGASLKETLSQLCEQLYISYDFVEGHIILTNLSEDELPSYSFRGYVSDRSSGEDLISATIAVEGKTYGVYTNEFGYFALRLRRGKHDLVFSYLGFEDEKIEVDMKANQQRSISLKRLSSDLPTVTINPHQLNVMDEKQLGQMELSNRVLSNLPELGSESDLVKGLETLPGVKRHSDLSSFFYVRGGDRDQNVIIIDDAPIYNPSHFLGLSSLVIPDFAKSITVYKSDVPTSLGDRLSSIVSIRTRDGNLNKFQMSGALNPLVNRLSVEIPVIKERSSIFASYRRSAFELLNRNANPDNTFFFQDFHFKWNYKPNQKNRFFITLIQSSDDFSAPVGELSNIKAGNFAATLRWNRTLGSRLFVNTTLYTGNYSYVAKFIPNLWQSELGTLSLKSDFTHFASSDYNAKFGVEAQGYFNTPGRITLDSTTALLPAVSRNYARKIVLYYQGQYDLSKKVRVNGGFRLINWENTGPTTYNTYDDNYNLESTITAPEGTYNSYFNVDPRLSLQYKVDEKSQLKLSYGIYHQYLQLISNSISPFTAMEVWLTASPHIRPQVSSQWAASYYRRLKKNQLEFSASAYYKSSKNQIDFDGHSTIYLNEFIEGELRFGTAESYGLELMLKKQFGRLNGSLAYTYARVYKKTDFINNEKTYRAFQDRPHDLAINLQYNLSKRFSCAAHWTSYSGSPFTAPIGFYSFNDKTIPIYGERNNDRLPAYHRLDVACTFDINKKTTSKFQHSVTFSIYNALGRKNTFALKFNKLESDDVNPDVPVNVLSNHPLQSSQLELAQFFPSLTYNFNFN